MRILLLNQYFPPDAAATATMAAQVARALASRFAVTVLAGRPSYDPAVRHPTYLLRREVVDGLMVERVGSTAFSRHRMRGRLANYLSYLALAVARALAVPADAVLAMTDPPVAGIAGALVAAVRRRPFVYNIRDLYPDVAVAGGLLRPGPHTAAWERLHRWALRRADRVIVLGDDMRERVIGKGVPPERVAVVRDGSPPLPPPSGDEAVGKAVRGGLRFVVLHAGNIGFAGAWETLVEGVTRADGQGVGLAFVGDGAERRRLEARRTGDGRIRFLPFFPAAQVPDVLAAGDLHVVTVRRGLEGAVVPSKLYGILAAGRPVLVVASEAADAARIVRRYRCGLVADPDSPESVATVVRAAMADRVGLAAMGERARAAAREFDQQAQLDRFVKVVEQALAEGGVEWEV